MNKDYTLNWGGQRSNQPSVELGEATGVLVIHVMCFSSLYFDWSVSFYAIFILISQSVW